MIQIPSNIIEAIYAQARDEAPLEACGMLSGSGEVVAERHPMRNVDQSPEHFTLDPKEHLQVMKQARQAGRKLLAVYHSHPATPARPSQEDIRLAFDPSIIYIIASLHEGESIKAFRIQQGNVENVELQVI